MRFGTPLFILLVGVLIKASQQISLPSDPTYHAGVVEFSPSQMPTDKERVRDNMLRMKNIIESEDTRDLDIIVFPESVLNNAEYKTYVPDPELKIAPCDIPDFDNFLSEISCAARSRQLYVIINLTEKEYCKIPGYKDTCNASGFNTYNTNVVIDRQGRVISRYRKTHLYRYEWYAIDLKPKYELAKFETDFGVTFGHFICFDMLFYEPSQVLIKEHNISDIIYPTFWFSELPFLTALQLQEGWAFANDVNLLAADGSNPAGQNTGSGIYAGRLGRLVAEIFEDPTTKLLKAKVPKRDRRADYQLPTVVVPTFIAQVELPRFTKMSLLRDYNLEVFNTKLLAEDFTNINENLCHSSLCCTFDIKRTLISSSTIYAAYRYRLVAYDGSQTTFQRIDPSEIGVCALVACTNSELYSCGHIFPAGTLVGNKYYFNSISVSGAFRNNVRRSIQPSSIDGNMLPLPAYLTDWLEEPRDTNTVVTYKLKSPKSDILTFGIWTNYYTTKTAKHNLDPIGSIRNGALALKIAKLNLIFVVLAFIFKVFRY